MTETIRTAMVLPLEVDYTHLGKGVVLIVRMRAILPKPGSEEWEDLEMECMDDLRGALGRGAE